MAITNTTAPLPHAPTHAAGGTDPVPVTTLAGYPGGTVNFLRADGTFAAPTAIAAPHHVTHETGGTDAITVLSGAVITSGTVADARLSANVALKNVNNNFSVGQTVTGLLTTGTLTVTGAAGVGGLLTASAGLAVTGNASVTGLLTVTGFGFHQFVSAGVGTNDIVVRNTAAGGTNAARFVVGNDTDPQLTLLQSLSSTYSAGTGWALPNSTILQANGAGGVSMLASAAGGTLRFYTGSSNLERLRIHASGGVSIGNTVDPGPAVLGVSGFGAHTFIASGTGAQALVIQNLTAGTGNYTQVGVGNDTNNSLLSLYSFSSTYSIGADTVANGSLIRQGGAGGLIVNCTQAAPIRFMTSFAERMRVAATGEVNINTTSSGGQLNLAFVGGGGVNPHGMVIQNTAVTNAYHIININSGGGVIGGIQQNSQTSVAFLTTSDGRLKDDAGCATDLTALRAITVHDFTWKADGRRDRGVFAQEAHALYPRAVSQGTDDTTDDGTLKTPWMTDYSKFVPDLIVGWQQHDAELAALRALIATVKGSPLNG